MFSTLIHASLLNDATTDSFSVRSMGRGGAEVAEPYGAESLTSNPAGLAQRGSGIQYNNLDFESDELSENKATLFHRRSFGVGTYSIKNDDESVNVFNIGIARRSRNGVDWGLNYKTFDVDQLTDSVTYWSSDLGAIMHLNRQLDVGFVGKNIIGDEDRPYSSSFEAGILFKSKSKSFKLYSDLVSNKDDQYYSDSYVRYGFDYELSPDFTLRAGGDERYYTGGASFNLAFFSVDYAVKSPKYESDESVVALGVRLGRAKEPEAFRRRYAMFKPNSIAYIEIDGKLTSGYSTISLLGGRKIGSNDLLALIDKANDDVDCKGYLIRIKYLDGALTNIALVQEIRSQLQKGQLKGKKIYVFLDGIATMPSYYLASIADSIVMPPMGAISQLGIQFELLKFDDAMKKFGIDYKFIDSGKYKLSTSPFSPKLDLSQKLTIKSSLENIMAKVKSDVQESRSDDSINPAIYDGRIISAERAKEWGLIDHVGFWSDMKSIIGKDIKNKQDLELAGLGVYQDDSSYDYLWSPFNKIVVVEIDGPIQSGQNRADVLFGGVNTGADEIAAIFNALKKDVFLKGVILRVNSPGGSIIASDQILHSIQEFRLTTGKPVYASMGNIAASGGYYIAMGSDQIFANPATITGSIGVVSGFLNFSEFEKKWGISSESLSTGKYMDAYSPHQPISEDAIAMLHDYQQESYLHFKSLVQESRDLTDDEVTAVAQGQFMTGEEALSFGLVDQIGSYSDTVEAMEMDLGLSSSRLVVLGRPQQNNPFGFLKFLFN